jgi:hypothetical protein
MEKLRNSYTNLAREAEGKISSGRYGRRQDVNINAGV